MVLLSKTLQMSLVRERYNNNERKTRIENKELKVNKKEKKKRRDDIQ